MQCFALVPNFHIHPFVEGESECLLPKDHKGYHLNKLKNGNYISWGGNGCDESCGWCGECFCHVEIDEKKALEILNDTKKNFDD
jgi:hypothetical protein